MANRINFISNNVKGFQSTSKRLKLIKYFKDKIVSNGLLFLQKLLMMKLSGKMILRVKSFTFYSHSKSVMWCFDLFHRL